MIDNGKWFTLVGQLLQFEIPKLHDILIQKY